MAPVGAVEAVAAVVGDLDGGDAQGPHGARLVGQGGEVIRVLGDQLQVGPVVQRQHRHRRVEGAVLERQRLGPGLDRGRRVRRALGDHHRRRLDRRDLAVGRLVAAGASADVDDRARVAERLPDRRREARVGGAGVRVGATDQVVLHASSSRSAAIRSTTCAAW
jgi:hypothetical protein